MKRYIVFLKQVPQSTRVEIDPITKTLKRSSALCKTNPDDLCALQAALNLKKKTGAEIVAVSMGPAKAENVLREALQHGADRAILLSSRAFAGSDTWCTSAVLAAAVRKIGSYDILFFGRMAIDGDTAQVGPQIAEHLGIPVISYAQEIKVDGDAVIVKRQYDDGYHMLKAKMPCLVTALSELNEPRYMTPGGIFDAVNAEITTLGRADLVDVDDSNIGLKGSPTKIAKASDKVRKGAGEKVVPDSPDEAVSYIVGKLKDKHVI